MLKILKSLFYILGIVVFTIIIFAGYHLYKAYKSGDLKSYFVDMAVDNLVDESKLSPTQMQYLEEGNYEGLVEDIGENVTPEQVDCAVEAVGEQRANELMEYKNPTPQEVLKLSKCL